jgi:hypothetical protein
MHMDLADVHAWTTPRSTRGRCAKSLVWAPKKKVHYFEEKKLTLGGFELQSIAWKSSV